MAAFSFEKVEGLGNDFIVVDVQRESDLDPALVPRLCDRHFGVGADGVLLVLPPSAGGVARMRVRNADGSVPEMCGNGLRCVAHHVAERAGWPEGELLIETDAGPRLCKVSRAPTGADVDVDMGVVRVLEKKSLEIAGISLGLTLVDAGNPHAIAYREDPAHELPVVGPRLAIHPSFATGTNVELVRWVGPLLEVHVWERGVGPTLACGTGACAVVAMACARGEAPSGSPVRVRLPGGDLLVTHDAATGRTSMLGPARRVFRGTWA